MPCEWLPTWQNTNVYVAIGYIRDISIVEALNCWKINYQRCTQRKKEVSEGELIRFTSKSNTDRLFLCETLNCTLNSTIASFHLNLLHYFHIYSTLWHFLFHFFFSNSENSHTEYNAFWHVLRIIGFCLSFGNSCANPIALYFVSAAFRKHFNR